ncbi:hypothetical protein H4CHR_04438 [Variovorax sp. PBS-H4]|uniref:hypothetical protein n=1 Tax=Variovorax sp. PBS-H4 TaxID=434008 RepID=UPI0013171451|nr:hypothetical protein [Variovorax sp. PBS-H4]VTU38488.1 hypothetical protein H4CHR_04438 [Variovorax sp. PBS-H4]
MDDDSMREESKQRRAANREHAPKVLAEAGVKHTILNHGAYIRIGREVADFWPGTGKWIDRKRNVEGRGVKNLIAHLKRSYPRPEAAHTCHWPGCPAPVPPAMWGCRKHWFTLPKALRDDIWRTYVPGQEKTKTPSPAYLEAAHAVQAWISNYKETHHG